MSVLGFQQHDHHRCIQSGLAAADAHCRANGLHFTPVRRRVLEILLERHTALGAYDILEILRQEGFGSQPPVAYRALDFLISHGFAHRIERLNAFIACGEMGKDHTPVFLICRACDRVAEVSAGPLHKHLGDTAQKAGFSIDRFVAEAIGLCPDCRKDAAE